jgi:hypothetical protein
MEGEEYLMETVLPPSETEVSAGGLGRCFFFCP